VTTSDAELLTRVRLLQTHGQEKKNHHVLYGFNSRLDEMQAAVLRVKLRHLDARNRRRQQIAAYYGARFGAFDVRVRAKTLAKSMCTPVRDPDAPARALTHTLARAGVETGVHYPVPLHRQPCWLRRTANRDPFRAPSD